MRPSRECETCGRTGYFRRSCLESGLLGGLHLSVNRCHFCDLCEPAEPENVPVHERLAEAFRHGYAGRWYEVSGLTRALRPNWAEAIEEAWSAGVMARGAYRVRPPAPPPPPLPSNRHYVAGGTAFSYPAAGDPPPAPNADVLLLTVGFICIRGRWRPNAGFIAWAPFPSRDRDKEAAIAGRKPNDRES